MEQIAIVGIGCRYAGGVTDASSLWEFLLDKRDGVVEIPADRWSLAKYYDADPEAPGRMYTRRGAFLTDPLWEFDADFFGVSAREAAILDPQQRLLLEVAWEALEDAGVAGQAIGGSVGVFVGGFTTDNMLARLSPLSRSAINRHTAMSFSLTLLSNRISHAFDFRGPSMTIDTACSSSLVAFHQAATAMAAGDCELALVGGVNVIFKPETSIMMCKGRFLASDGRSKSFDAAADGYGRGEGAGMVVLKRLDAALRDHDRIYAVVRGSGVNQDGRTPSIPVPNPVAQEELALRVCRDAGLSPHEIAFIEAHGTGTPVGDPIEMSAMGKVYGTAADRVERLYVGSLKSSIGHTEAASGIAGLIKAALTVQHRMIAPQGWLETLNPAIPFEQLNIEIPHRSDPHSRHLSHRFGGGEQFRLRRHQRPRHPRTATRQRLLDARLGRTGVSDPADIRPQRRRRSRTCRRLRRSPRSDPQTLRCGRRGVDPPGTPSVPRRVPLHEHRRPGDSTAGIRGWSESCRSAYRQQFCT